ncbi:MAG: hypothetical protein CR982_10620 [Candidatus Cloacimonadota bacterium]|nr:MAG: hypothetical protein CR982_10620 [Candidatus Cloacimonadota bacterium]PIE77708.1 MAG: hypothetical protein CSA15_11625 [Candidatus Delongbacteria bacterium]
MSFWRFILLIVISVSLISCGDSSEERRIVKNSKSKKADEVKISSYGPVSVKKYNTPEGADPKVSAEMGGDGFEEIAESLGWQTKKDVSIMGSPNAIKGGELNTYFSSYPVTLRTEGKDAGTAQNSEIGGYVYETLLGMDPITLEYVPGLATHWKIDKENKTMWFRLNPKARWSDGKPVVSNDYRATLKLLKDPKIAAPYTNQSNEEYELPEIVSKYIFKVKYKSDGWRPFYMFSFTQALPSHHLDKIDGAGYLEKYQFTMLPGTGPYILDKEKSRKGKKIVMRRRSDYWGENERANIGANNFDQINYFVIQDENLIKEKFKKGELDWFGIGRAQWWIEDYDLENPGPGLKGTLDRGLIQKRKIFNSATKGYGGICFNTRKPPFDDIRVREAFIKLWNREQLNEKMFYNEYILMKSHYSNTMYESPANKIIKYDQKGAGKLLDAAGWSKRDQEGYRVNDEGERLEVTLSISQGNERIYTLYQEDLKRAGVKLNLKITDWPTTIKMMNERRFKIALVNMTSPLFPNIKQQFHSEFADKDNTINYTGIKNPRLDELIEMEAKEFDLKKRVKIIQECDSISFAFKHIAFSWYPPHNARLAYWNKFGMPDSYFTYYGGIGAIYSYWWNDPEKKKALDAALKDESIKLPIGETIVDYWNIREKNR